MSSMTMMSPAAAGVATAAMMVAMMLPSIAPTLWRHHRHLRGMRLPGAGEYTLVFALGYAGVWSIVSLALSAMTVALTQVTMASSANLTFAPWTGAVMLCAGILQRSRWKAALLVRCRRGCESATADQLRLGVVWRDGCRLGVNCVLSCAAPMAVLYVAGLMDTRMMVAITAAITAERVPGSGPRIARLTGAFALVVGFVLCM